MVEVIAGSTGHDHVFALRLSNEYRSRTNAKVKSQQDTIGILCLQRSHDMRKKPRVSC